MRRNLSSITDLSVVRVVTGAALGLALTAFGSAAEGKKVTYEDDVLPIFRDNCLKCHNPDKQKGDLDLSSFSAALKGGGGGVDLNSGDAEGSPLYKSITHADDPSMPPNAKLTDRDILVIRQWIEGGLLRGAGSKAIAASKPAADLALKSSGAAKPEGPPPMPGKLPIEPVLRAERGTALGAVVSSPWAPVVAMAGAHQVVVCTTEPLDFAGVLPFPEGQICDLKFSRNGKLLLAGGGRGGKSGLVVGWDITTGERVITIGDQFDAVLAADLSADQRLVALGGPDRVLKIYATKDGALQQRVRKHTDWVTALEFSPDGRFLASGDRAGGLFLWEAETGRELYALNGHKGAITAVSWRADSEMLVSASEDGTLKLWKAADGSSLRSITAHPGGALAARFAPDGRVVSSGRDNKLQVWNTAGKSLAVLAFSGELPNRVTFTHDGARVVASDWAGRVLVWEASSGRQVGELESNPPPLAERVVRLGKAEVDRKREAEKASADLVVAEAAAAKTAAALAVKKTDFEAARAAGGKATSAAADGAARKAQQDWLAAAQKAFKQASTDAEAATKKLELARLAAKEAGARLTAAETALKKWDEVRRTVATR
jgi:hypothetical protein